MDKVVKQNRVRPLLIKAFFALVSLGILFSLYFFSFKSKASYDIQKISTSVVKSTDFQEIISFSAISEPVISIQIPAIEGGNVGKVLAEAGQMVEKGQTLLELSNPDLVIDFMNRETQIIEQINNLRNARISIESSQRSDNERLIDIEYQLNNIARQFKTDTLLYTEKVISRRAYEDSQAEFKYLTEKKQFLKSERIKNSEYVTNQITQIDSSIALMERNLKALRKHLDNLQVVAPISGMLVAFDFREGATISKSQNIARIDVLDNYQAAATVDEHYISRVKVGQKGTFTLEGRPEEISIKKIYPSVNNGQFRVDLEFINAEVNERVKNGQTFYVKLPLSEEREALVISKGEFFYETSGNWLYVLTDGIASKRQIKLGKQNTDYYEVLSGLSVGEEVITSSYAGYENAEELHPN